MIKNKDKLKKNQHPEQKKLEKLTIKKAESILESLSFNERAVFNFILEMNNYSTKVTPSVETIGIKCQDRPDSWKSKLGTVTVHRILNLLEKYHLIKRIARRENDIKKRKMGKLSKTNLYLINPSFYSFALRNAFKNILPALKCIPLFILLSFPEKLKAKKAHIMAAQEQRLSNEYEEYRRQEVKNTSYFKIPSLTNLDYERDISENGCINFELSQKRRDMIPEMVKNCSEVVNLTLHGKVKLACLETRALEKGLNEVKKLFKKKEKEKFAYLFKIALEDMKERNIIPDWELYKALCSYYNLSGHEEVTTELPSLFVQKILKAKRPSNGPYAPYRSNYVSRKSSDEVLSQLAKDEQFKENLKKLGFSNPSGFFSFKDNERPPSPPRESR